MNSETEKKQEVRITDIRMPFGSMVMFMVKWAVASIPAMVMLVILGAVFWGTAIGVLSSIRTTSGRQFASGDTTTRNSAGTAQQKTFTGKPPGAARPPASASVNLNKPALGVTRVDFGKLAGEELAYIQKLQIADVRASESRPEVLGDVKNTGDRTLEDVVIVVECLDSNGKLIFETESRSDVSEDYPLEPGHWAKFTVPALGERGIAPPNWRSGQLKARVAKVKLQ